MRYTKEALEAAVNAVCSKGETESSVAVRYKVPLSILAYCVKQKIKPKDMRYTKEALEAAVNAVCSKGETESSVAVRYKVPLPILAYCVKQRIKPKVALLTRPTVNRSLREGDQSSKSYTNSDMRTAIKMVYSGYPVKAAAELTGVPHSNLEPIARARSFAVAREAKRNAQQ